MIRTIGIFIICIVFISLSTVFTFSGQFISELELDNTTENLTLKWKSVNEDAVNGYILEFSFDDLTYHDVKKFNPKGSKQVYLFTDKNFPKYSNKKFFYRLRILTHNDIPTFSNTAQYSPGTSMLKQTWDSIKAVFQ